MTEPVAWTPAGPARVRLVALGGRPVVHPAPPGTRRHRTEDPVQLREPPRPLRGGGLSAPYPDVIRLRFGDATFLIGT
jgi:hypothetical protein